MDYKEALAHVSKDTPTNYMLIKFGYSNHIVLPYKAGVALLQTLEQAESMTDSYSNPLIVPIGKDDIFTSLLSGHEYRRHKMAALMGIKYAELEDMERNQAA